ncbi:MAG: DUF3305 domain-containing protein [Paracoccaceae bacterium]
MEEKKITIPVGVVIRRTPGVTKWAKWAWRAVAVLPGAPPADWRVLRRDGDAVEFHAGTLELELFRTDTEAYLNALAAEPPAVFVIMNRAGDAASEKGVDLHLITASAYEAQDYQDSGEEIVEPVPMPEGLVALIRDFVDRHHVEEKFVKRRRNRVETDRLEEGKGDPRIPQAADVYRSPGSKRKRALH